MEIERASFGKLAYTRRLFRELYAAGALFFVARHGRELAGYALGSVEGDIAEIVSIAVDPADRGAGVGKALLVHLLETFRTTPAVRVELVVRVGNRPALRLYRALGFRRVRLLKRYYEDGADGWLMSRSL